MNNKRQHFIGEITKFILPTLAPLTFSKIFFEYDRLFLW